MAGGSADQLHRLWNFGAAGAASDGELLDRFVADRGEAGEAAFEELVGRHGPLVLRVCRGVLHDAHDAEDAFQAVFLVLANRADSVRERGSVASWLFGVAHRVAIRGKRRATRRRALDRLAAERATEGYLAAADDPDWEILHEEIADLPERLRAPVVLCHLQGLTYDAAATRLGASAVAVRGRLARAREKLKRRLTRRGVTASAGFLVAGAVRQAEAAVPASLIHSTLRIAQGFPAGGEAAVLARGVLNSMLLNHLKVTTVLLCLGAWGGHHLWSAVAADDPAPKFAPAPKRKLPASPAPTTYRLTGSVRVEGTGEPVPGARITVMLGEAVGSSRPDQVREIISGTDGRFATDLPPGQAKLWTFQLPAGYWSPGSMTSQETFVLGRSHEVHQKDYTVRKGKLWALELRGPDGGPLQGGAASSFQGAFVTAQGDQRGRVELTLPTEAGETTALVNAGTEPTFRPSGPILVPLKWDAGFLADEVTRVERVEGVYHLTDVGGRTATIGEPSRTFRFDPVEGSPIGGKGRFEPSIDGGKLVIRVVFEESKPATQGSKPATRGSLVGRVVDRAGMPIEGVRIAIASHMEGVGASKGMFAFGIIFNDKEHESTTDREGRFRIDRLPIDAAPTSPQKLSLLLTKKGLASLDTPNFEFQPAAEGSPHELEPIRMEPGASLSGIVVDPDGKPVVGAWVRPMEGLAASRSFTKTDAAGRFVVDDLPSRSVNLQVEYGSLTAKVVAVASEVDERLKIQLRPQSESAGIPLRPALPAPGVPTPQ